MGRINKYSDGVGAWRRAEKKYLLGASLPNRLTWAGGEGQERADLLDDYQRCIDGDIIGAGANGRASLGSIIGLG